MSKRIKLKLAVMHLIFILIVCSISSTEEKPSQVFAEDESAFVGIWEGRQ